MFDIFEQPWAILGLSVLVLFGVLTYRSIVKKRWWHWLLPICCAGIAFGADFLVRTDTEKISQVLKSAIQAVSVQSCDTIESLLAENYSDTYHSTKRALISHCQQEFESLLIENARKQAWTIQLSPPKARTTVFLLIRLNKNSSIAQIYKSSMVVKADIYLQKQLDSEWLINRIEILEVDRQPITWQKVR